MYPQMPPFQGHATAPPGYPPPYGQPVYYGYPVPPPTPAPKSSSTLQKWFLYACTSFLVYHTEVGQAVADYIVTTIYRAGAIPLPKKEEHSTKSPDKNNSPGKKTKPVSASRPHREGHSHATEPTSDTPKQPLPPIAPTYTTYQVGILKESITHLKGEIARLPHPPDSLRAALVAQADTLFDKATRYADSTDPNVVYKKLEQSRDMYQRVLHSI